MRRMPSTKMSDGVIRSPNARAANNTSFDRASNPSISALGYAEADPSADIDGFDARSKLVLLAALAFGERITPSDIFVEGIRRITPLDFDYAHQLQHTIRLVCSAAQTERG